MSTKPTIVVVILAVIGVVAAVVLWRATPGEAVTSGPPGGGVRLAATAGVPVEAVDRITLARLDEPTLVFARADGGWMQIEPFRYPMQFYSMRQLAELAAEITVVARIDPQEQSGTDLGLDPPLTVLTCGWPDGEVTLQLGRRGVAGRSYLRAKGDPTIHVVTGELYERAVETDPKNWRDRTLFAGLSADTDHVEIADGLNRTVIERVGKRWMMIEPLRTRADELTRNELFSALARARSDGFILDQPDDLAKFGLAEPAAGLVVRATARTADGESTVQEQRLLVGSRMGVGSEDRFALVQGRPVVVRLPEPVLRALFVPLSTLIDPTASGVNAADVKTIVIRRAGGELRLQRDLERWLAPDLGAEVSAERVETLLDLLTRQRAAQVEIVAPLPAGVMSVTLYGFGGRPLDTVRIVSHPDRKGLGLENGDNVLRIFPPDRRIPVTAEDFGIEVAAETQASP